MSVDPGTLAAALPSLKAGVDLLRGALGLVKDVKDVLPEGEKKSVVARTLVEAEKEVRLAEAQIAMALGYTLCQCTFPPQIMLSQGRHADGDEIWKCSRCGKQEPSEQYFMRRRQAYADRGDDFSY